MNVSKNITISLSHLFFPHTCSGCGSDLVSENQLLCLACIDQLPLTRFENYADNPVEKIFYGRVPIVNATSLLYFTKDSILQHLLHQFKYRGKKEIGSYAGGLMGNAIRQSGRFDDVDAIVPLPLFAAREKKRGYNQAAVLSEGIADVLTLPVLNDVIIRPNATQTQTHKSRVDRWTNIAGKFVLKNTAALLNKHLLLVDDVVTTGATLEICARELLKASGARVSVATFAYTYD